MKVSNSIRFELENFEKIVLHCAQDTSLGALYDFSCAVQHFVLNKMKEIDPQKSQPPATDQANIPSQEPIAPQTPVEQPNLVNEED